MNKECLFLGNRRFKSSSGEDISSEFDLGFSVALKEAGYHPPTYLPNKFTLDYSSYNFIEHLIYDDLVIVNLTDESPSVYYQLSIRHFLEKPIIHIISDKSTLFDLSDPRFYYIHISKFQDLNSIKKELLSKIILFDENKAYGLQHIKFIQKTQKPSQQNKQSLVTSKTEFLFSQDFEEKNVYPQINISTFVERRLAKNELVRRQKQQNSL